MALRIRRGLSANRTSITPLEGEFIYTTDTKQVYVGDGVTAGGVAVGSTSQYLQVANAIVTYQTKSVERAALANTNSFIRAQLANTNAYIATRVSVSTFNSALANTNAYIATKLNTATFNSALANTNAYIATRASWTALTSTNTSLRTLINSRLQVANVVGVYQTIAVERAVLANTNARINLINQNLTATNTAVRALVSDRLQVANASALYQTKSTERSALANTNASIASQSSRITLVNTNLTGTNTALRVLIDDRYQVSNVNTLLNAKATWAALTSTNTSIRNYVDTKVSDIVGSAPATLNTLNELSAALANDASFSATITYLIGTKISVANTKAYLANTNAFIKAQLANTNSYIATKLNTSTFNSGLANTNAYIATKLNTTTFNSALANTNAYIASVATNSSDPATRNLVFSTNTALRSLISDRLQVANAAAVYQTKSVERAALANTNAYIATRVSTSTFNSALANTNSYIASVAISGGYDKATWSALTSTNTALRTLISDRLQVANAAVIYQTKTVERAALANTNAYIATQTSRITLVNTNLTSTNTALRTLISDRLQVANASTLYVSKSNPTTSGLLAHTGRATISTNLAVSGNATVTGTMTATDIVSGRELTSTFASNDEGGQVNLAKPPNATISGDIVIDAYQNRIRIFENGGTFRGAYIDLTAATAGVGSNLLAGGGGGSSNGFSGILVGANVISADSTTDRLTFVAGSGITLAANPTTDTITISSTGGGGGGGGGGFSNGQSIQVNNLVVTGSITSNNNNKGTMDYGVNYAFKFISF